MITRSLSLSDRYTAASGTVFMTGVQALARVLIDQRSRDRSAGLRTAGFVSGYPGSPLGGFDLELGRHRELLAEHDIVFRPGLNEELAATAVMGSQLANARSDGRFDGVFGMWFGKAPGLDRAGDVLKHANYIGVGPRGGAVAVVGDDPSCKSSTLPSHSEPAFFDALIPVLAPADVQDVVDLGLHGFALSRASGLWSGLKLVTNVADGSGTVTVGPDRVRPRVPTQEDGGPLAFTPDARLIGPRPAELERSLHAVRLAAAVEYGRLNELNSVTVSGARDRIGVIGVGKAYLDLRQALDDLGLEDDALRRHGIRLLKVAMPFPMDQRTIREFAEGLEEIVVVEEKRAFVELFVKDALYPLTRRPAVVGKQLVPADGELDPDRVAESIGHHLTGRLDDDALARRVAAWPKVPEPAALTQRTPYFCSGCPHNSSLHVPTGTTVGAGIGCHGMVLLMRPEQVGDVVGMTPMGAEGSQWIGMAPFVEAGHLTQNLGDGTLAHSGTLAIRAAVASGERLTYKILHNSAVAMTGGQEAAGGYSVPELTRLLAAQGVRRTIVTAEEPERYRGVGLARNAELWPRERLEEAQRLLAATPGVTALIHDQECAAEKRRKRKRGKLQEPPERVFINERVCEGCGDCGVKSNCLSVQPVETEFGRKTQIHQASCNKDFSCLEGDCPSFLMVTPSTRLTRAAAPPLADDALPPPAPAIVDPDSFTVRVAGVGGTGVVTVAQVLAVAALLEQRSVRGLDQTGLAQKGGAVVSDIKVSRSPRPRAAKAARAECDLLLACDLVVAAEARHLAAASRRRTVAIASTATPPTADMVVDADVPKIPSTRFQQRIASHTRADDDVFIDAHAVTQTLFGTDQGANVLLLGAAVQAGALPLAPASIEEALRLNGAAVDANIQAFRRGRQAIADPPGLRALLDEASPPAPPAPVIDADVRRLVERAGVPGEELQRLLELRAHELVGYQGRRYAERYVAAVAEVRAAERDRLSGSTDVTEAFARGLYKLMAYKDEYEVARLHLDPAERAKLAAAFGEDAKVYVMLHPPLLRALGLKRKLKLGAWISPAFRILRSMRRLRGTPLDPFGYAGIRRVERALPQQYLGIMRSALRQLRPDTRDLVVELAALPDVVRGYEEIKRAGVDRFERRARELLAQLERPTNDIAPLDVTHVG